MKRAVSIIVLSLPFLLGAAAPPQRPRLEPFPSDVVTVNFIDRLMKDVGAKKSTSRSTRHRQTAKPERRRAVVPAAPPIGIIPVPLPKPENATTSPATETPKTDAVPTPDTTGKPPADKSPDGTAPGNEVPGNKALGNKAPGNSPVENKAAAENPPPAEPSDTAAPAGTPPANAPVGTPPNADKPAGSASPQQPPVTDIPKPTPKPEEPAADQPAAKPAPETDKGAKPDDGTKAGSETTPATPSDKDQSRPDQPKEEVPPPPPLVEEDPDALKACLSDLKAIGAEFKSIAPIDDGNGCGIRQPIDVAEVLPGVDLGGATMRCQTALTMAHWLKDTVQPAMNIAMPGRKITGIVPGSTYQCRLRNSATTGKISEHARGNAFDVAAFKLDNGDRVEMKPRDDDHTLEGAFQKTATAGACLHFTTVLAPGSDAAHENHLHLDIIERNGGYRICE